jgi:hypothetical protein
MLYAKILNLAPSPESPFFRSATSQSSVSSCTFAHCLNALWVSSEVMLANTTHFYLHTVATHPENGGVWREKLNRFQRDLAAHSVELQGQIVASGSRPAQREKWDTYADLCSVREAKDFQSAKHFLQNAASSLADLYENALVLAAQQPDRASALYLFAHHLTAINAFLADSKNKRRRSGYRR